MMRDLIKQILREETSGLTDEQLKSAYNLMDMITEGYHWYHDTPEQPFKFSKGSIWLINPKTKEWSFQLGKEGILWYSYHAIEVTFYRYFGITQEQIKLIVTTWAGDNLGIELSPMKCGSRHFPDTKVTPKNAVKDVLKRGKQIK
jgi:hypothetical protein